ncbi:MAG: V-type ATPase subunit [Defluviitaleaceae bacterium]|nr:V-type ATPase subunit [Defluviitaleaceae bacterium]
MKYAAVNAKINSMKGRLLTPKDYESISKIESAEGIKEWLVHNQRDISITPEKEAAAICLYLPDKIQKSIVMAMACRVDDGVGYYTSLWKLLNRLDKPNKGAIKSILGAEIDLTNILWMYRLKRYRRVKGDTTYGYLVPVRYRLSQAATHKMAHSETPKALLDEVAQSPYGGELKTILQSLERGYSKGQLTPEQQLVMAVERRYIAAACRYPDSLVPCLAYLYRKKLEAANTNLENHRQQHIAKNGLKPPIFRSVVDVIF